MNKDQALNKLLSLEHHVKEDDKTIALEIIKDLKEFFDNKPKLSSDMKWLSTFVTIKQRNKPTSYMPRQNFIIPTSDGLISTNNNVLLILKNVRPEGKVYDLIQDKWLDEQEYALLSYSGAGHIHARSAASEHSRSVHRPRSWAVGSSCVRHPRVP